MNMKRLPQISESEWEVMKTLWDESPLSSLEIAKRLKLHPQTTRTFISRLVQKKAIRFLKKGRAYLYEPSIEESDCKTMMSRKFLQRVFGGSLQPMLTHLVKQDALSEEEMDALRKILRRKGNQS